MCILVAANFHASMEYRVGPDGTRDVSYSAVLEMC